MSHLRTEVTAAACVSRNVGALTSKTAARYSGWKSSRSLFSMFTNTYVAAVGMPVRVDMGRCRAMAWYARKMNDIASIRKTRPWPPSLLRAGGALALAARLGRASLTVLDFALRGKQISLASGTVSLPTSAGRQNNPVHAQGFHD